MVSEKYEHLVANGKLALNGASMPRLFHGFSKEVPVHDF
jgi:hypothetical protein